MDRPSPPMFSPRLDWLHAEYKLPIVAGRLQLRRSHGDRGLLRIVRTHRQNHAHVRALVASGSSHAGLRTLLPLPVLSDLHPAQAVSQRRSRLSSPRKLQLRQAFDSAADPKTLVLIPGADHFFTGHLEQMQKALAGWLKEQTR